MSVVILLADGVRPDTLRDAIDAGSLPALKRLRDEGGLHTVATCFPSVTGPAYTPFLMGRFPGPVGLPGIRWYDRDRDACSFPDYTRSYVGYQVNRVDTDVDPAAPTIFELAPRSVGSLSPLMRGLPKSARFGTLTPKTAWLGVRTHFTGNVAGWLWIDRALAGFVTEYLRRERPDFAFSAMVGIDKTSHAVGQPSPLTDEALRIVDETAATIRADAERDGRWADMHLWITSDHGHSPVHTHEDLAGLVAGWGFRVMAHPWVFRVRPDVAVMVSGNAMAHLYLIGKREAGSGKRLAELLLARESVDLLIERFSDGATVRSRTRGDAAVSHDGGSYTYRRLGGDPLAIGRDLERVSANDALAATLTSDYPDSLVQIAHLAASRRAGDIMLSATPGWDYRSKYEPIPHVSAHGGLHREHMLVPLLVNRRYTGTPRRTVDIMPSALAALGREVPAGLDGRSFV